MIFREFDMHLSLTQALRARLHALILVILMALSLPPHTLTPPRAHAQSGEDVTAQAVALNKRAQAAAQAGRYEEATRLYRQAIALIEHPDLLVRLAQVLTIQGDHKGALASCQRALSSELLTSQTEVVARECVQTANARLDEVVAVIDTNPQGAKISLDGSPIGLTPWRGVLPPGRRQFDFELDGYRPSSRLVDAVKGSKVNLRVLLLPNNIGGLITLHSTPEGANVLLDDEFIGQSPIISFPTSVGAHTLKVVLPGYNPEIRPLVMSEGQSAELSVYLAPERGNVSALDLWPAWAMMGASGLMAALGGLTGWQALNARDAADNLARNAVQQGQYNIHINEMETYRALSDVMWISSGVLLTGGITWWLFTD